VHSPAVIIGTAVAITVAAGTAVAVTLAGHHGTRNPAGHGTTPTTSVAAGGPRHSPHGTPTSKPSPTVPAIAVNPSDPCTWLTSADFARVGLHPGHLSPGSFPGGWKACRNGRYYVGMRSAFLTGCPPSLGLFTCTSVSVPGASSAQFLDIPRPPEAELHAERGGLQYSIGVPRGVAGSAVLIRLMELVLSRTAH
jgi:hypothetical protein